MAFNFILNERALKIKDFLVITDIHIGYETALGERGYSIPKLFSKFFEKISELKTRTNTKRLIIMGDIKHNVPQINIEEKYDVPTFFHKLSRLFDEVIIVKGNHDGNIEKMIHEPNVQIVNEYVLDDYGFTHGHRSPSEALLNKEIIFMGHVHPTFKIKDSLGVKHNYPCWIIGKLIKSRLKNKKVRCKKVVVVPAFNALFSGYGKFSGPLAKMLKREEVYLLDLTKVV